MSARAGRSKDFMSDRDRRHPFLPHAARDGRHTRSVPA